jgi:hypothetical protein
VATNLRVYHYLPAEHALSNIALGRIKISILSDLNDPFELLAVNTGSKPGLRIAVANMKKSISASSGMLCFSRTWHNPVMWSHYADRHRGVCLGFDIPDGLGQDINYADKRILAEIGNDQEFTATGALANKLLFTKYAHWQYEQEHRVFVELDRSAAEGGLYFYDFRELLPLRTVYLGPLCSLPLEGVRALAKNIHGEAVHIQRTRLAFKSFSVVEVRRARATPPKESLRRAAGP